MLALEVVHVCGDLPQRKGGTRRGRYGPKEMDCHSVFCWGHARVHIFPPNKLTFSKRSEDVLFQFPKRFKPTFSKRGSVDYSKRSGNVSPNGLYNLTETFSLGLYKTFPLNVSKRNVESTNKRL